MVCVVDSIHAAVLYLLIELTFMDKASHLKLLFEKRQIFHSGGQPTSLLPCNIQEITSFCCEGAVFMIVVVIDIYIVVYVDKRKLRVKVFNLMLEVRSLGMY